MSVAIPQSIKWGVVGLGRCGSNLAEEFYLKGYSAICLNTSHTDLRAGRLPHEKLFFMGLRTQDGAGQDMTLGERCLTVNRGRLLEFIAREITNVECLLLTAGLAGGTGSGIGALADILNELKLPMCALVALPSSSEGAIAKVNAVRSLNNLIESQVKGYILIDNQKILNKADESILLDLYNRSNREVVSLLDNLNRISRNPGLKPLIGFDSEDLKKFFETRGVILIGNVDFDLADLHQGEALFHKIKGSLEDGGWLCGGKDFHQATMGGIIFAAPKEILKQSSAAHFAEIISDMREFISSSGLYTGVFEAQKGYTPKLMSIIAGLPMPKRVEEIVKQAKAEKVMLKLKSEARITDLDFSEFNDLTIFGNRNSS